MFQNCRGKKKRKLDSTISNRNQNDNLNELESEVVKLLMTKRYAPSEILKYLHDKGRQVTIKQIYYIKNKNKGMLGNGIAYYLSDIVEKIGAQDNGFLSYLEPSPFLLILSKKELIRNIDCAMFFHVDFTY